MNKLYVVVGRFQPFHNGHKSLIDAALNDANQNDKVLILVGSSNKSRTLKNPLTYDEREQIIKEQYGKNVDVKPLPDFTYQMKKWENNLHNLIQEHAEEVFDERYFATVFVSSVKEGDHLERESWKSGALTFAHLVPSLVSVDGESLPLSATHIRNLIAETPASYVAKRMYSKLMPRSSFRVFATDEIHDMIKREHGHAEAYKESWKDAPFTPIFQTTDALVVDKDGYVLLISRGGDNGKGQIAMAGGYLESDLTLEDNMKKELLEETNLDIDVVKSTILGSETFDQVGRSARGRIITTAFVVKLEGMTLYDLEDSLSAGDDASEVHIKYHIDDIKSGNVTLYSDHSDIISKLCETFNL